VPSASQIIVVLVAVAGLLAGCGTTQETSARLKIRADRILASREPVEVGAENPAVRVLDAAVLRSGDQGAIAVTLRNVGGRPLSDLPVLLGVRSAGGDDIVVNRGHSVRYFEAHTPGLPPHLDTTWVFTAPAGKLPAGKPVVRIGRPQDPPAVADALPEIGVSDVRSGGSTVRARVDNDGDFPQYDLAVYAWAKRDGRFVAAARKAIGDLGTGKAREVRLDLVGDRGKAAVHVSAPPTIFE
jgi:hypothetical protein